MPTLPQPAASAGPNLLTPAAGSTRWRLLLLFLGVVAVVFGTRTAFFWHHGQLLAGTHADEPFHYAAELVRLAPDHYPDDPAVQDSRNAGEPYASFYKFMGGLVATAGLTLAQANFVVCWTANLIYLAGVLLLLHRLGLPPWLCAVGTILVSQRFALVAGQTLVTHGLAIPREVWQALLPWFLLWFVTGSREKGRLVLFYAVLGAAYTATYAPWAVELGLAFGLVDLWRILHRKNWRELIWLAVAAAVCLAVVAMFNLGQAGKLGGEESALFERMQPGKAIYFSKGFRRFVLFSLAGLWGFWELGRAQVKEREPLWRLWQLWLVTAIVCWVYQPLEMPFRALSLLFLGRLSMLNFLISLIVVMVCLHQRFAGFALWKKSVTVVAALLLCGFSLRNAHGGRLDLTLVDFCQTLRTRTPVNALFFVPPVDDVQYFRVYAERGMWIAPYDKTTLVRTKQVYAQMQDRVETLKRFYQTETIPSERETILKRLRDEGVNYVVTRSDAPWAAALSWPVVLRQGPWQLHAPPRKGV